MQENQLYPLKFEPILKDKVWGGSKLRDLLNKEKASSLAGESWEISGVQGDVSVVKEGFLAGNNLQELIEVYMGDLVGEKVYEKFGPEFPLLIKFIDANQALSIQVHPDDELARARHNSFGKTEMWYIMQADEGANIIVGFNKDVTKEEYMEKLDKKELMDILNADEAYPGDVFFLPAKRVHAIGAGIVLAEIQQTSDVTYRIYDYDRPDTNGNMRELHTDLALDSIDYKGYPEYKTAYNYRPNESGEIVKCPYFQTFMLEIDRKTDKDFALVDSFIIYLCVEGEVNIQWNRKLYNLRKGETILIPAVINIFTIDPVVKSKLLEVYLPQDETGKQ
jgi:mannose-6-phosphate isomerase